MKKYIIFTVILLVAFLSSGCERTFMKSKANDYTKEEVFESLWNVIDQKYSFFDLKGIDWQKIHDQKKQLVREDMTALEFYKVLYDMLYELKDGHVNLNAGFDYSRNWEWYLDAPQNFSYAVVERNYLGKDYWSSGGLKNSFLDKGKYGYIYYSSFTSSAAYIDVVLARFKDTKGIIIDVRNNGGGSLDNATMLADYLADKKRLTYKMYYKKGAGHNDFSEAYEHYSQPRGSGFTKPVVILTNRSCYSATSFFVTMVKEFPNVIVLGDKTGGGAGLPMDYLLPCGWQLRFSTTRTTDAYGADFEGGVAPDMYFDLNEANLMIGEDTMIERAKEIIDSSSK